MISYNKSNWRTLLDHDCSPEELRWIANVFEVDVLFFLEKLHMHGSTHTQDWLRSHTDAQLMQQLTDLPPESYYKNLMLGLVSPFTLDNIDTKHIPTEMEVWCLPQFSTWSNAYKSITNDPTLLHRFKSHMESINSKK